MTEMGCLIRAVVFDMDGVLIDAKDWHYRALNEALAIFGAQISLDEHINRFDGLPTKVKLRSLSDEGRLPPHLHEIVEAIKQERTLREAAALCFPRIEHLLLMAWLKERKIKIGVATNSIRHSSQTMLGFAGILPSLDVLVTNEDVVTAKPAPDIYVKAASLLDIDPSCILVIEDHNYGVTSATIAGCNVIKVSGIHDVTVSLVESWINVEGSGGVLNDE